mmetsp:Transcript_3149/g.6979  ORF Transcript_3149/g.6979 Transcript_3149/m.6979 type:complete len:92 (+) Transcript_3149:162-437(+)
MIMRLCIMESLLQEENDDGGGDDGEAGHDDDDVNAAFWPNPFLVADTEEWILVLKGWHGVARVSPTANIFWRQFIILRTNNDCSRGSSQIE